MNREAVVHELMAIGRLLVGEETYRHDPEHKHQPKGGGWVKTEKGWTKTKAKKPGKAPAGGPKKHKAIEGTSPQEYASLWGHTNGQGGAHFYNYGSEHQTKDKDFYDEFLHGKGGIHDTIKRVESTPEHFEEGDLANLHKLRQHVEAERAALG
jgi:hypothetical protein